MAEIVKVLADLFKQYGDFTIVFVLLAGIVIVLWRYCRDLRTEIANLHKERHAEQVKQVELMTKFSLLLEMINGKLN